MFVRTWVPVVALLATLMLLGCSGGKQASQSSGSGGATGGTDTAPADTLAGADEDISTTEFVPPEEKVAAARPSGNRMEAAPSAAEVERYVQRLIYPRSEPTQADLIRMSGDQAIAMTKANASPEVVKAHLQSRGASLVSEDSKPEGYHATMQIKDDRARIAVVISLDQPGASVDACMVTYTASPYAPGPGGSGFDEIPIGGNNGSAPDGTLPAKPPSGF